MNKFLYPYFHTTAPAFIIELSKSYTSRLHKRGTVLMEPCSIPQHFHFVKPGICSLIEYTKNGLQRSLGIMTANTTFAETFSIIETEADGSAEAITDCEIIKIPLNDIYSAADSSEKDKDLLKYVIEKLHYVESIKSYLMDMNVQQRIAVFFKSYSIFYNVDVSKDQFYKCHIQLTQDMLAKVIHSSRVSTTILVGYLTKNGYLAKEGQYYYYSTNLLKPEIIEEFGRLSWETIRQNKGAE